MSDRQAFTQRETETLSELIGEAIMLRSQYRLPSFEIDLVKVILDLRSLSERCYAFLVCLHKKSMTLEDLAVMTLASEHAGHFGTIFCQAFMIEGPKFDELLHLYGHHVANPAFTSLFDSYKGDVMQATSYLSDDRLERDLKQKRQRLTNIPTRIQGYRPNQLKVEGTPEAMDLSAVLFPDQVLEQVETAFRELSAGSVRQAEVIELFARLKSTYPSQTSSITERITIKLYALPASKVPELRQYAFNTVEPSLHECSVKTSQVLRNVFEEPVNEAKTSLKDLFDSLAMNKRYLERCAALDIASHIQEQMDEAEHDTNDYLIGGTAKAALYAEFFQGLKRLGMDMDFMLVRGVSNMTTGATCELIDRGPKAVIHYAIKNLCKHYKDADTNVTKFFLSAWVLTFPKSLVLEIIKNSDVAKVTMYSVTSDQDYLHDIKKAGLIEDVLIRDLGV